MAALKKEPWAESIDFEKYAKFFSDTLDTDSGKVTWQTWLIKAYNAFQKPEYLGYNRRLELNGLGDRVNSMIVTQPPLSLLTTYTEL
ncbi:unnamed protein product [Clonostachys rhizophaga]|uniref:Uncharacterized protein n=1 Tax=Clonostachys rhizophaga TaxID=160324 RepID=A0A9N9VBU8_9HYPO|nr:unnamed protein product [Clonostachys rhizophaga]